jgi:protein-S-isoprenylcysteine O-methyltransferase Ste14
MEQKKNGKGKLFAAFPFYFWIAFEFAYMAGPFAAFFYGAYSPVLNFLNNIPALAWMTRFFLPHVVRETSSWLLNLQLIIGAVLALGGFVVFLISAIRIYSAKLLKKGAVTGGLYKYIRHPQYSAFIVSSFGMLLLWPRYMVLIGFVSMLFIYYFLALAEERECLEKFGESYASYMRKTGRFFPRIEERPVRDGKRLRGVQILGVYAVSMLLALFIAYGTQLITVNSLYAVFEDNAATVSLCALDKEDIASVKAIALSDSRVEEMLRSGSGDGYLNYVLPTGWYAAEVPMNGVEYRSGHASPQDYDHTAYKIIFTAAQGQTGGFSGGKDILLSLRERTGLAEVWVDLAGKQVTAVYPMPENVKYSGIPEAIY